MTVGLWAAREEAGSTGQGGEGLAMELVRAPEYLGSILLEISAALGY
jgi:hypothetical protein